MVSPLALKPWWGSYDSINVTSLANYIANATSQLPD
jgi:hypothetical protein